jgi:hypothetical protein
MKMLSPEARQREADSIMQRIARRSGQFPDWRKTAIKNWDRNALETQVREMTGPPNVMQLSSGRNWWDRGHLRDGAEVEESGRAAALARESLERQREGRPSRLHEISAAQHEHQGEDDDVDADLLPNESENIADYFARLNESIDFNDPSEKFFIDGLRSFASRFRGDARASLLDRKVLKAFLKPARRAA